MTRLMSSLLFGIGPLDAPTYLTALGVLPARRHSRATCRPARMAGKAVRVKAADPDRRVRRHQNCAAGTAARPMAVAIRRWL
jgi:hypothetical protein